MLVDYDKHDLGVSMFEIIRNKKTFSKNYMAMPCKKK
jgi:hypothetical protein